MINQVNYKDDFNNTLTVEVYKDTVQLAINGNNKVTIDEETLLTMIEHSKTGKRNTYLNVEE